MVHDTHTRRRSGVGELSSFCLSSINFYLSRILMKLGMNDMMANDYKVTEWILSI